MADTLFSSILNEFSRYVGVTEVFPEIPEILAMERNLKLVNVQLSSSISNIEKLGKTGPKFFKETTKAAKWYSVGLSEADKSAIALSNSIDKQSISFGVSRDTMLSLMQATSEYGFLLSSETVGALAMFQQATGISEQVLGSFTAKMVSSRRLEDSETKKYLESILAVRDQYGMATDDLYGLFNITEKYANIVGATGENLKKSTAEMAKFITLLKQAGLEANFATDILDKMFDPLRAQDNMVLLSKLGITMGDVSFGNLSDNLEASIPRLRQLAEEILSTPGRVAQAKIAEVYGLTLEEVRKMANIEVNTIEASRAKTLEKYRQETQTAIETIKNSMNTVFGAISMFINNTVGTVFKLFSPGINAVLSLAFGALLTSKVYGAFSGRFRASLTDSVRGGTSEGISEALIASEARIAEHFKKATGLGVTRSVETDEEYLNSVLENLAGGKTIGTEFKRGFRERRDRRARPSEKGSGDRTIEELYELSNIAILEKESMVERLKSLKLYGHADVARTEAISALNAQIQQEQNRIEILAGSETFRADKLAELEENISEASKSLSAQKEISDKIKTLEEEILKADGTKEGLSRKEFEIKQSQLEIQRRALGNLGPVKELSEIKAMEDQRDILKESVSRIGVSDETIKAEYDNVTAESINTMSEKTGKVLKNMDKNLSGIFGVLPRMGGTLGRMAGFFTSKGGLSATAAIGAAISVGGAVFKLSKDYAERDEETKRSAKVIQERSMETIDNVKEIVAKPLSGIYSSVVKRAAERIENERGMENLEDATIASIIEARTNEGKLIAVIESIGNDVSIQAKHSKETSNNTKITAYSGINA